MNTFICDECDQLIKQDGEVIRPVCERCAKLPENRFEARDDDQ